METKCRQQAPEARQRVVTQRINFKNGRLGFGIADSEPSPHQTHEVFWRLRVMQHSTRSVRTLKGHAKMLLSILGNRRTFAGICMKGNVKSKLDQVSRKNASAPASRRDSAGM